MINKLWIKIKNFFFSYISRQSNNNDTVVIEGPVIMIPKTISKKKAPVKKKAIKNKKSK